MGGRVSAPDDQTLERIRAVARAELRAHPMARPWWHLALVVATVAPLLALGCAFSMGLHPPEAGWWAYSLTAGTIFVATLLGIFVAMAPGRALYRLLAFAALSVAGLAVMWGGRSLGVGDGFVRAGAPCAFVHLFASVLPMAVVLWGLTQMARDLSRALLAGLAAGGGGLLLLHLHCPNQGLWHLAAFHLVPWLLFGGAAAWARARMRTRSYAP
jgi:hypothetical protein